MTFSRFFLFCLFIITGFTKGFSQDFTVDNYSVEIHINSEGYFEVYENYDVDFKYHKHGIYRDIITSYDLKTADGSHEKREIKISDVDAPGHLFEASGKFSQRINGTARIKIGDPNKTVIGPVHYKIYYRVDNAFLFEQDYIRFYWNLKSPEWYAPFKKVSFRIYLPNGIRIQEQDIHLYSGLVGNTAESEDFEITYREGAIVGKSKTDFISTYNQSVTLLLNLPVNSIEENKPFWPFWTHYGWLIILGMFALFYYWLFQKFGKDDPSPAAISYFPPDDMDPAMAGFLINDKDDTSDLISLLPYWGTKGLIEIEEIDNKGWFAKDDTRILKLADIPNEYPDYQKTMFNGLFKGGENEVLISSLKNSFYTTMSSAKIQLKKAAQKFYEPKSRKAYFLSLGGIILTLLIGLPIFFYFWGLIAMIFGLIFGVILIILNQFMVKKNPKGIQLYSELKGFRKFIKTAETDRLKFLLKESPSYFETTMPFALTFGTLDSWARKFNALDISEPTWYRSSGTHHNMGQFSRSFTNTMNSASSTMVSSPSSSSSGGGGGSSGGGFGGGGGGSW
jgi:uncharacterized membrane protein YgcG